MATIQALPKNIVRSLGSSQAIPTIESVIKELIDNALDATATAISIEVTANTLDLIQLRDNGHGVAPEDRHLVCRRYCTSKIKNGDDLRLVGGRWLGFRGEALANLAELSGGLLVTTRVEGESVATCLRIGQDGEVAGRDTASHPVGTSVRISHLFQSIPIRKQAALKKSTSSLLKIKRIVQAYALARPSVRFSLKIVKAKSEKGNWIYAPKLESGIEDACAKVVGKDCASQCRFSSLEHDSITMQAFLPRTDATASNISNAGHFLSVDYRPVSAARGFLRLVLDTIRGRLKASNADFADVKDPFVYMNIVCPRGSYDVNIEPLKDDVLFEDTVKVLEAVEKLLDTFYPAPATLNTSSSTVPGGTVQDESIRIFEDEDTENASDYQPAKRQRIQKPNMDDAPEDLDDSSMPRQDQDKTSPPHHEDAVVESAIQATNPFVIAKMNARMSPRKPPMSPAPPTNTHEPLHETSPSRMNTPNESRSLASPSYGPWDLPTPENSSPLRKHPQKQLLNRKAGLGFTLPQALGNTDHDMINLSDRESEPSPQKLRLQMRATDSMPPRQLALRPFLPDEISPTLSTPSDLPPYVSHQIKTGQPSHSKPSLLSPTKRAPEPKARIPDRAPNNVNPPPWRQNHTHNSFNRTIPANPAANRVNPPFKRPKRLQQPQQAPTIPQRPHRPPLPSQSPNHQPHASTLSKTLNPHIRTLPTPPSPSHTSTTSPPLHDLSTDVPTPIDESLPLEGPLYHLQNLVVPLRLTLQKLEELVDALYKVLGHRSDFDELLSGATAIETAEEEEVQAWREKVLEWVGEYSRDI